MKKGLFTLGCLLIILNVYAQKKTSKPEDFNLGVGLGIPYGIMGIGVDFAIIPNINLHGSIGSIWLNGIAYNVGVDVYFRDHNKVWRPKAIILYGVNGVIEGEPSSYFETKFTTYRGISIGLGQNVMFGKKRKHGFNFSVFYVINKDFYDEVDRLKDSSYDYEINDGRLKLAVGYQYKLTFER